MWYSRVPLHVSFVLSSSACCEIRPSFTSHPLMVRFPMWEFVFTCASCEHVQTAIRVTKSGSWLLLSWRSGHSPKLRQHAFLDFSSCKGPKVQVMLPASLWRNDKTCMNYEKPLKFNHIVGTCWTQLIWHAKNVTNQSKLDLSMTTSLAVPPPTTVLPSFQASTSCRLLLAGAIGWTRSGGIEPQCEQKWEWSLEEKIISFLRNSFLLQILVYYCKFIWSLYNL